VSFSGLSVLLPTSVSFSICNLDTPPAGLSSKKAVFGPDPLLGLLDPLDAKISLHDAGLPFGTPEGTPIRVFRLNENTSQWEFALNASVVTSQVRFQTGRFGTYAVQLLATVIDTTWRTIQLIPPSGGTLNLLNSRLVIPAGALPESTTISFEITVATPIGLPGATNRVFDFGPEGTVFLSDITLYVPFEDAGITGEKIPPLRFYWWDPVFTRWDRQPTDVDWLNQRFVVRLRHFSRYAFGR
jgi:hypothetical protein